MRNIEVTFEVTLELDEQWASNHTADELVEYIKERMRSTLGFRGQIKTLRALSAEQKAKQTSARTPRASSSPPSE
jgi:hypothetical protein